MVCHIQDIFEWLDSNLKSKIRNSKWQTENGGPRILKISAFLILYLTTEVVSTRGFGIANSEFKAEISKFRIADPEFQKFLNFPFCSKGGV